MFAQDLREPGDEASSPLTIGLREVRPRAPCVLPARMTKVRPEIAAEGLGGHGEGFHFIDVRAGSYLPAVPRGPQFSMPNGPWCAPPGQPFGVLRCIWDMANHEAWAVGVHLGESYVEELFRARYLEMVRLAGLLGADDPEDIAQEAFTRLMNKEPDLGDARAALAYLRAIVVNLTRNRHRHLRVVRLRGPAAAVPDSCEQAAIAYEDHQEVIAALAALPARRREAIVLRYWPATPGEEPGLIGRDGHVTANRDRPVVMDGEFHLVAFADVQRAPDLLGQFQLRFGPHLHPGADEGLRLNLGGRHVGPAARHLVAPAVDPGREGHSGIRGAAGTAGVHHRIRYRVLRVAGSPPRSAARSTAHLELHPALPRRAARRARPQRGRAVRQL